jgi:hypothetical protein
MKMTKNFESTQLENLTIEEMNTIDGGCQYCMDVLEGAVNLVVWGVKAIASLF